LIRTENEKEMEEWVSKLRSVKSHHMNENIFLSKKREGVSEQDEGGEGKNAGGGSEVAGDEDEDTSRDSVGGSISEKQRKQARKRRGKAATVKARYIPVPLSTATPSAETLKRFVDKKRPTIVGLFGPSAILSSSTSGEVVRPKRAQSEGDKEKEKEREKEKEKGKESPESEKNAKRQVLRVAASADKSTNLMLKDDTIVGATVDKLTEKLIDETFTGTSIPPKKKGNNPFTFCRYGLCISICADIQDLHEGDRLPYQAD